MKRYTSYKPSGVPWLGDIPAHWISAKLKFRLERNDGGAWGADPEGANDTLVLRSTEQTVDGRWKLEDPAYRKLSPTEAEATLLVEGDLLVTKSSGSETHIGKTSLVDAEIATLRAGYSNFMQRLRVVHEVIPKYVWYLLNSGTTKTQVNILASTTTGLANLNAGVLGQLILAYPPPEEQQAIADYLDAETARIDTLIHEKDELIGLLKEWRQSMIAEVVTKGLDKTVTMKPSGVPWLGDVPAHWNLKRVKHITRHTTGWTPPTGNRAGYEGSNLWATIADLGNAVIHNTKARISDEAAAEAGIRQSPTGSLLFSFKLSVGQVSIVGEPMYTNEAIATFLSSPNYVVGWAFYAFPLFIPENSAINIYGAKLLNQQRINDAFMPVPPPDEQQAIADYLDTETSKIDALIAHAKDDIVLLKELRAATIADAVLGRIDVRTH